MSANAADADDRDDFDDEEDDDAGPKAPAPGARGWKIVTALLAVFFIQLAALTAMLLFSEGKSAADGPGAAVTLNPSAITARASGKPGSDTIGVPASDA